MSAQYLPIYRFGKGLVDKPAEDFQAPDEFRTAQNVRFRNGVAKRRKGAARIAVAGSDNAALNYDDASSEHLRVPLDTRVHKLGLRWTVELLVKEDNNPSGNEYLCGWFGGTGSFTIRLNSSRNVVAVVWDSAATATTLTSASAFASGTAWPIQLVRDGASLTLRVANVSEATGTMSGTLLTRTPTSDFTVAAHNNTEFFDGTIDYCRAFNVARADHADGWRRLTDPRAEDVLWDYGMEQDANAHVMDRSVYGNTALAVNTPTNATALCVQSSPILMMQGWLDANRVRKCMTNAGGLIYNAGL